MGKTTHGKWKSKEWNAWDHMRRRCNNPQEKAYKDYGGRGIRVCERWMESFENFYNDMGPAPSPKHSLDRYPNNDGNYEPGNCRWATTKQQAENRRHRVYITYKGMRKSLAEWSRVYNVTPQTIKNRFVKGYDIGTNLIKRA